MRPSALRVAGFWFLVLAVTLAFLPLLPALLAPRRIVLATVKAYLGTVLWLLRRIAGVTWEIRGEIAKARAPVLVAAKHQSAFETIILQYLLGDPAIILKSDLLAVPVSGWVMSRLGHLGAERPGGIDAVRRLTADARRRHQDGRPVVIFPEGTRKAIGAPPDYKAGVELLYGVLKAPCVPVAVNSGHIWPARSLYVRPGRIVIAFLPEIEPHLTRAAFRQRLTDELEAASAYLLELPP